MPNLPLLIARRYLFAKKSQNIINIISMISAAGVMVGTAALLIVLSVFNGLNTLVASLYGSFDPDLKMEPAEGKTFDADSTFMAAITSADGVEAASTMLMDNVLLRCAKRQMPATVLGVDSMFTHVSRIDSIMRDGSIPDIAGGKWCALGFIVADQLGVWPGSYLSQLTLYAPKRTGSINMANPDRSFVQRQATVVGTFAVQQVNYDSEFAIVGIDLARDLFCYYGNEVSAIGIKVAEGYDADDVKSALQQVAGEDITIKNLREQHGSFYRMMEVEKLMAFIILTFIIVIAAFNIIGSLSMLIFEKKESISILKSMGADRRLVTRVFLFEGWLVSLGGVCVGLVLGVVLVLAQQHFGIVGFSNTESYIIEAYPVELRLGDVLTVFVTVALVGILAAWYPVKSIVGRYYRAV